MRKTATVFKPTDRVAFAAAFLKSIQDHERGRWRGTVISAQSYGSYQLCAIKWDHGAVPSEYHTDGFGRVISPNLTLVARIAIDAALTG